MVGVGTGGTVTGVGRYLKERNPTIKVWGIDTYGSVFKKFKETGIFDKNEIYPYITEGIGEDFLPKNVDFDVIDHFEKVTDKDAALMTRRIAREEGIFAGNSAGSAMAGLLQLKDHFREGDVVVVIFHDHGSRYLGKMFNDDWMREKGLPGEDGHDGRATSSRPACRVSCCRSSATNRSQPRFELMAEHDFSQISVTQRQRLVGSLNETHLYAELVRDRGSRATRRVDHAAGVPVRGRLYAGRAAGDDDHAGDARGARARFQDRQDVHHHQVGHHSSAVLI